MSEPGDPSAIDFRNPEFLYRHIRHTMAFYHPRCIDREHGGFFQHFRDDGSIYDAATRHLVSSTRFIFNYAMAATRLPLNQGQRQQYLDALAHGVNYLRQHHLHPQTGGYAWLLRNEQIVDATNHCYGLAFVMLAYASALRAGMAECADYLDQTFELMERHFWSEQDGLYRDEISADWSVVSPYRGQNANMHSCEAMIAAYEATGAARYLDRAFTLAHNICIRQAALTDDLIWEHYDEHWQVDWNYNRDDPQNLFRPWGFQPGHMTEWAKLLLILDHHRPQAWLLPRARQLFDSALARAWDQEHGGICYGFAPDGEICDGDKYFWVQAESLAAAALLAIRSGEANYWEWYRRIWAYAWQHLVDHQYGAWFRILDRHNRKYDDLKSPAGKTDYHTMGACYEVIRWLAADADHAGSEN
ncbi:MAG: AGE family epimerase/isomerase [Gammaproteobacteria bacterium]|nr:AGE family epimerase/isomerase [Gammaproteobacteria bacterium]